VAGSGSIGGMVEKELRDFEIDIARSFKLGGYAVVSPTAMWVRGHLLDVNSDYVYGMWKRYVDFKKLVSERLMVTIRQDSYSSFRTFIYLLRKLRLVLFDREEKARGYFRKKYYRLNRRRINDPSWKRPFQTAYPVTDWKKKTPREIDKLRKKYPRSKGKRVGRPPKYFGGSL